MLERTSRILDVLPAFRYYDDRRFAPSGDAQAVEFPSGTDGTVYFGLHLLQKLRQQFGKDVLIAATAIGAHEFAHILQFKHGLVEKVMHGERSVRRLELQADFLAGYVAGKFRKESAYLPVGARRAGNFQNRRPRGQLQGTSQGLTHSAVER
jgi:predicted metalloprotease